MRLDDPSVDRLSHPECPQPFIDRANLTRVLLDMVSGECYAVRVVGPSGAGKTCLLAQLARENGQRCVSFFCGGAAIVREPRYFLLDLVAQLDAYLDNQTADYSQFTTERIGQAANDLTRKALIRARKTGDPLLVVVDGLQHVGTDRHEDLLAYLPARPGKDLRMVISGPQERPLPFEAEPWQLPLMSPLESSHFLRDLELDDEVLRRIHEQSGGLPVYLAAVRRLIEAGVSPCGLSAKLPDQLGGLFAMEWERAVGSDPMLEFLLALIAFGDDALSVETLGSASGSAEDEVARSLAAVPFIVRSEPGEYSFACDAYRRLAGERLAAYQQRAATALLEHYLCRPTDPATVARLPALLSRPDSYARVAGLLTPEYYGQTITASRDTAALCRASGAAAEAALGAHDWAAVARHALCAAALKALTTAPTREAEVDALLALRDYAGALDVANRAVLPEDRLHMLALVAASMQRHGVSLPQALSGDIRHMAETVDLSYDEDKALEVGAAVFAVVPAAAVQMVERAAGLSADASSLDAIRMQLALRLEAEGQPSDALQEVRARIGDVRLRAATRWFVPRVAHLNAHQLLGELPEMHGTSEKVQFAAEWCAQHREDPDAAHVVDRTLTLIAGDPDYGPPLRVLRQLAEALVASPDVGVADLATRMHHLRDTSLRTPAEEWIRLEILLALAMKPRDPQQAVLRMIDILDEVRRNDDTEARCSCWAWLIRMLPDIADSDDLGLAGTAREAIEEDVNALLQGTADHYLCLRNTLHALAPADPDLAVSFALRCNTVDRRDQCLRLVLRAYVAHCPAMLEPDVLDTIANALSDTLERESAALEITRHLSREGLPAITDRFRAHLGAAMGALNPIIRGKAAAYAAAAYAHASDRKACESALKRLDDTLRGLVAASEKGAAYLAIAEILAPELPDEARACLAEAKECQENVDLADRSTVGIYVQLIRLAIEAAAACWDQISGDAISLAELTGHIARVGDPRMEAALLAELGLRLHHRGQRDRFCSLMNERVIPLMEALPREESLLLTLELAPSLFALDPEMALMRIRELDRSLADAAHMGVIGYLVHGPQSLREPPETPVRGSMDASSARYVLRVLSEMRVDGSIYGATRDTVLALTSLSPGGDSRRVSTESCPKVSERDALQMADELSRKAHENLPDPLGIAHEGYCIVVDGACMRLRAAAKARSDTEIDWVSIASRARGLANVSDRVLVLCWVAEHCHPSNHRQAVALMEAAQDDVSGIPGCADRAERFLAVVEGWHHIEEDAQARVLLAQAIPVANAATDARVRDDVAQRLVQLAQEISPDLAATLVPQIESPFAQMQARLHIAAEQLRPAHRGSSAAASVSDRHQCISTAARLECRKLRSGRGRLVLPSDICPRLTEMRGARLREIAPVVEWFVVNAQHSPDLKPLLRKTYEALLQLADMTADVARAIRGMLDVRLPTSATIAPNSLRLFRAGDVGGVLAFVREWISQNAREFLVVYDPYFGADQLSLLDGVPADCPVQVITTWKETGVAPGDRQALRRAWAPAAQSLSGKTVVVTLVGSVSGSSPQHERYLVSRDAGLLLGGSLNALGKTDTTIRILPRDETDVILEQFVNPLLTDTSIPYGGELLARYRLHLDEL